MEVQYNTPYGHSFGMGDHFLTGRNGLVRFEQFNPDLPGEYEFIVSKAIRFQPLRQSLSMQDDPIKLKLQPGLVVSGTVIDDQTGRPLPGVDVYAVTAQYIADKHPHWLNADAKTDAHGKFIFTRLADREYIIDCRNAQILNSTARDGRIGILDSGRVAKPLILRVKPRE